MKWQHWTYLRWNELLIEHYFGADDEYAVRVPVERIPAAPEDLWGLAGRPAGGPQQVVDAFLHRVRQELPPRKASFCSYCSKWEAWNPNCTSLPHFFAMLWLTCHIASGYPVGYTDYFQRVEQVLGRRDHFRFSDGKEQRACLPDLWKAFQIWTRNRHRAGERIRPLELPKNFGRLRVIGYSHYLAFPNRSDRTQLAIALRDADLVGFEPPIEPTIRELTRRRDAFSADFSDELDDFVAALQRGDDPRTSSFWRAIRQESLDPYSPERGTRPESPRTALLFQNSDDGLWPFVACRDDATLPDGFSKAQLDSEGLWPFYIVGPGFDEEAAWRAVFDGQPLVPPGVRRLLDQGVLALRECTSGCYEVVHGRLISGASCALVRRDTLEAFTRMFGGTTSRSVVEGWFEVIGCHLRQLRKSEPGLEHVTQLLFTMDPPSVALVGGVRTSDGFFCPKEATRSFLPRVRAPGAIAVSVANKRRLDSKTRANDSNSVLENGALDEPHPCMRTSADDWQLPLLVGEPGTYELQVTWPNASGVPTSPLRNDTFPLRIIEYHLEDDYRGKPAGDFYVEGCPRAEEVVGDVSAVPLGITTTAPAESEDLLDWDASVRYLGPGLGEMSLVPKPGFDWMVIGPKNSPEMLVFIGDTIAPMPPSARRSPNASDRRLWQRALSAKRRLVRHHGIYTTLDKANKNIQDSYTAYRHHRVFGDAPICEETQLETNHSQGLLRIEPASATQVAADILAARSSRRSGLRFPEVADILGCTLSSDDGILRHQVLRSWAEAGLVDILRAPQTSTLTIVARRPRLIMVRRGPDIEATMVGLLNSHRRSVIERTAREMQIDLVVMLASNPWQPPTLRLRASAEAIVDFQQRAGLAPSEWLAWSAEESLPWFDVQQAMHSLEQGPPPNAYRLDALWDWRQKMFRRDGIQHQESVTLERRRHRDRSVIYVVLVDGEPKVWCHLRSWALLAAHAARRDPPFREEFALSLASDGRSPTHLPLPLARLCVLIGDGLPGLQCTDVNAPSSRYVYPFGRRLFRWAKRMLPREWIATNS